MQGNSERGWSIPCDHEILDAVHGFLQSYSSYPAIMYKSMLIDNCINQNTKKQRKILWHAMAKDISIASELYFYLMQNQLNDR